MLIFSTGELLTISGIPAGTLDAWVNEGRIAPYSGGGGHGRFRTWSPTQVVGFVVAEELRNSDRGCSTKYATDTITAFGSLTEKELIKRLEKRPELECGYIGPHRGKPLMTGDVRYFPSVIEALQKVVKFAHEKNNQQPELTTK